MTISTTAHHLVSHLRGALHQVFLAEKNLGVLADLEKRLGGRGIVLAETRFQTSPGEIKLMVKLQLGEQACSLVQAVVLGIAPEKTEAFIDAATVLAPNRVRYDPKYTLLKDDFCFFTLILYQDGRTEDVRQVW